MKIGLIARGDQGGLAALTWEFARHLVPTKVLLLDLGTLGRGKTRLHRYDGFDVRLVHGPLPSRDDIDWLLDGIDVVYTAETPYHPHLWSRADLAGVPTVLHVMPELFQTEHRHVHRGGRRTKPDPLVPDGDDQATALWNPTHWMADRLPERTAVVPVPVAEDRIPRRHVKQVRTLFHPMAPAMLDRNGSDLVLKAMRMVNEPCRLVIQGPDQPGPDGDPVHTYVTLGANVEVEWVEETEDYWEPYTRDDIDALLLPRRYGGLSLPMQQAAQAGWPIISLDLEPQRRWLHPELAVEPHVQWKGHQMKGGRFDVYDADPRALAAAIDRLVSDSELAERASLTSTGWADRITWQRMEPAYRRQLEQVCQ